jgi:hypothetical protein
MDGERDAEGCGSDESPVLMCGDDSLVTLRCGRWTTSTDDVDDVVSGSCATDAGSGCCVCCRVAEGGCCRGRAATGAGSGATAAGAPDTTGGDKVVHFWGGSVTISGSLLDVSVAVSLSSRCGSTSPLAAAKSFEDSRGAAPRRTELLELCFTGTEGVDDRGLLIGDVNALGSRWGGRCGESLASVGLAGPLARGPKDGELWDSCNCASSIARCSLYEPGGRRCGPVDDGIFNFLSTAERGAVY